MKNTSPSVQEAIALRRMSLVQAVIELLQCHWPLSAALEQVRAFPGVPVKLLYRQWKQADVTLPALSAIYRWLEQNDLDAHGRRYLL